MAKTEGTIRREMEKIAVAQFKVRDRIHSVSVLALEHLVEHGNTTLLADWINMLKGSGAYRQALLDWVKKHANVKARVAKDGRGISLHKNEGWTAEKVDVAKADGEPFWLKDTDANANLPKFDAYKVIETLLKKREKVAENPADFEVIEDLVEDDARLLAGIIQRHSQKGEGASSKALDG